MTSIVRWAQALVDRFNGTLPGRVILRYTEDQGWFLAAAVAYNALFSIFPIILLMVTILGAALRDPETLSQAISLIVELLPPELSEAIAELIQTSRQETGLLGLVSLLGLIYVSVGLFSTFEGAMDWVYRVPLRPFIAARLMGLLMILVFTVLIVLQVVAFSVAQLVADLVEVLPLIGDDLARVLPLTGYLVSAVAAFLLCLAFFYLVPNVRLRLRETLPGTLFATVALMLIVQLFPLYARLALGAGQYGQAFGFALLLMTWSYLVAHAFIIGAELNAILCPPVHLTVKDLLSAAERHAEGRRES